MSVYFIQAGEGGPIKIGHAKNVVKRIATLQTGTSRRLKLLAKLPGGALEESSFHETFAQFRLNGEWFEPSPELTNCITRLRGEKPKPPPPVHITDFTIRLVRLLQAMTVDELIALKKSADECEPIKPRDGDGG